MGRPYHWKLRLDRETRVELATLCLGSLCRVFRIYPKLQLPDLARLGPKPPEAEALCFRSQAAISVGKLGPTMTQRQATERDNGTIAAGAQGPSRLASREFTNDVGCDDLARSA